MTLSVTENGLSLIDKSFSTGADAQAYFTDDAFNALLALQNTGTVTLDVSLTVQTDAPGSGFYGHFIIGDPPLPSSAAQLASHEVTPDLDLLMAPAHPDLL